MADCSVSRMQQSFTPKYPARTSTISAEIKPDNPFIQGNGNLTYDDLKIPDVNPYALYGDRVITPPEDPYKDFGRLNQKTPMLNYPILHI